MKIILSALSPKLLDVWTACFNNAANVEIVSSDITTIECDAIVSPANSFGFMDGGLDRALSKRFGWDLQERLQQRIKQLPEAELLVGKAMVVETNDPKIPYLISAPTMRVPMNFNIDTSVNAYLAMKAALIVAKDHEAISVVAIPGFCTGAGGMDVKIAATQMYQAYAEVMLGNRIDFSTFGDAQRYQLKLNSSAKIYKHQNDEPNLQ